MKAVTMGNYASVYLFIIIPTVSNQGFQTGCLFISLSLCSVCVCVCKNIFYEIKFQFSKYSYSLLWILLSCQLSLDAPPIGQQSSKENSILSGIGLVGQSQQSHHLWIFEFYKIISYPCNLFASWALRINSSLPVCIDTWKQQIKNVLTRTWSFFEWL